MNRDYPCTSSIYDNTSIFSIYKINGWDGDHFIGSGCITKTTNLSDTFTVYPITVYEF